MYVKGFQPWLKLNLKDRTKCICKICDIQIGARFTTLKGHARTAEHCRKSGLENLPSLSDFQDNKQNNPHARRVVKAELRFVAMCAKKNVPLKNIPSILKSINKINNNKGIIGELKLRRTKATKLLVNVIGLVNKKKLSSTLRSIPFSICLDESTDVSKDKVLAILVRYVCPKTGKLACQFWESVKVFEENEEANAGSERLMDCVRDSFETKHNIPLENIFAICSDNCATMLGTETGLRARL